MQVLLSDACQQQQKPTIAFVGATIQPGLSDTASSMVSTTCPNSLILLQCMRCMQIAMYIGVEKH